MMLIGIYLQLAGNFPQNLYVHVHVNEAYLNVHVCDLCLTELASYTSQRL